MESATWAANHRNSVPRTSLRWKKHKRMPKMDTSLCIPWAQLFVFTPSTTTFIWRGLFRATAVSMDENRLHKWWAKTRAAAQRLRYLATEKYRLCGLLIQSRDFYECTGEEHESTSQDASRRASNCRDPRKETLALVGFGLDWVYNGWVHSRENCQTLHWHCR